MASQFNRALQQADRQRVTLGSTGITTTDVRRWLQVPGRLPRCWARAVHRRAARLVAAARAGGRAEAEFERDRPVVADAAGLPEARPGAGRAGGAAACRPRWGDAGAAERLDGRRPPSTQPGAGRAGRQLCAAAYRAQLLPLLGDVQARHLKGATGDMARQPWRVRWSAEQGAIDDEFVAWMSRGVLTLSSDTE
jgi:hypothetical protein